MNKANLLINLTKREILSRYKGSFVGILWSFLTPIFMLTVYTVVFSQIFKSRWPGAQSDSQGEFALTLFVGLIVFNFFSECINRAPTLIYINANYVKKVVFPLELLPLVNIGMACFHMLLSLGIWLGGYILFFGLPKVTALFIPIIIIPLIIMTSGFCYILASVGVYIRDISQLVGVTVTAMMFLSPIFFPISILPQNYQNVALINPISFPIEELREMLMIGGAVNWAGVVIYNSIALIVLYFGYKFFEKTRRGFADVL